MMLGKLPVPGRPTIWITVGQGPVALAVGAGRVCLDIFTLIYHLSPLSPSLWETARYRLKYYPKGPLNPKQPTNQPNTIAVSWWGKLNPSYIMIFLVERLGKQNKNLVFTDYPQICFCLPMMVYLLIPDLASNSHVFMAYSTRLSAGL